ncbi:hypothetical protein HDU96_005118, partial [Phlyctochytrium bullatum]
MTAARLRLEEHHGDGALDASNHPSIERLEDESGSKGTVSLTSTAPSQRNGSLLWPHAWNTTVPTPKAVKKPEVTIQNCHVGRSKLPDELVVLEGIVGSQRAKILIDSGANPSFVSKKFAAKTNLALDKHHSFNVHTASDDRAPLEGLFCPKVLISIGDYKEEIDLIAADIAYDAILGIDWMKRKRI